MRTATAVPAGSRAAPVVSAHSQPQCAGWVVDLTRRQDHACSRRGVVEGEDGQWFCRAHNPRNLPAMIQRLVREGKVTEARLVAERRGVDFAALGGVTLPTPQGPTLTVAQLEEVEVAVRERLTRLELASIGAAARLRAKLKLLGAMAVLQRLAGRAQ